MSRRAWTASELLRLRELRAAGHDPAACARKLHRTETAIVSRLQKDRLRPDDARALSPRRTGKASPPAAARRIDAFLRKPTP